MAAEVPNPNLQIPKNLQFPSTKQLSRAFWRLELGISLELGAWNLGF
jgi:hypothetical protein